MIHKHHEVIIELYQQCHPSKLNDVEGLLATCRGREDQLYKHICEKYKVHNPILDYIYKNAVEKNKALPSGAGMFGQPSSGGGLFGQKSSGGGPIGGGGGLVEQASGGGLFGQPTGGAMFRQSSGDRFRSR